MIFNRGPKGVKEVRCIGSAIFIVILLAFSGITTFGQENEPQVIDEVVAQVNDGVITLSQVRREIKNAIASLVDEKKISEADAKKLVEGKQGEMIANMINEEMILQKAKDLEIENEVTSRVNEQFLSIMKDQGLKTLEALFNEMRKVNVNPDDVRENYRRNITRQLVLENEVDRKIYLGFAPSELRKYYDENKEKLMKPETVTISEIFLNLAGRDKDALKAKAFDIVSKIRNGSDFVKMAIEHSDRPDVKTDKGKIGTFTNEQIKSTSELFAEPLKSTPIGSVTDPIITDEGIEIFRVDDRKQPNNEFDETLVRSAMTSEKLPTERKKYLSTLRKEGYVKISENYRAIVAPFMVDDSSTAEIKKPESKKPETKKKNK